MELGQITPPAVRAWYAAMEAKNVPTARARSYALLHQILAVAVDDGAITANPGRIKGGSTTRHKPKPTPDLHQARQIAARMPWRWRFLCVLAVISTARYGELVALRRRDLDLARMTVTIERQWYRGTFKETKRPASERTNHLPSTIRGLATAHLAAFVAPEPDALPFPTRAGNPPPTNWIDSLVRAASEQIGLQGVTFHSFRHLATTLTAQTGASTREIMHRMGQSTPRAAMIYQHGVDERDAHTAAQIAQGIGGGATVLPLPDRSTRARRARTGG